MNTNFYLNNLHNDSAPRSMKAFKSDPRNSHQDLESVLDSKKMHRVLNEVDHAHNETDYQFMNAEEKTENDRNAQFVFEISAPVVAIKASTFEEFVVHNDGLGREITTIQKQILADAFQLATKVVLTKEEQSLTTDKLKYSQKVVCIAMSKNNMIEEYITSYRTEKQPKQLQFIRNCLLDYSNKRESPRIIFNLLSCHVYMVNSIPAQHYVKSHRLSELAIQNEGTNLNILDAGKLSNKQLKKLSFKNREFRHKRVFGQEDIKSMIITRNNPPVVNNVLITGLGKGVVSTNLHKMVKEKESKTDQVPLDKEKLHGVFFKKVPRPFLPINSKKTVPLSKEQIYKMKRDKRDNVLMLYLTPEEIEKERIFQDAAAQKKLEQSIFNEAKKAEIAEWRAKQRKQSAQDSGNSAKPDITLNQGAQAKGNESSATPEGDGPSALEIRDLGNPTPILVMIQDDFSFQPKKLNKALKKIIKSDFEMIGIELVMGSMFPLIPGSYIVIKIIKVVRCNTLNGNNGSRTNTDDVDKKKSGATMMALRSDAGSSKIAYNSQKAGPKEPKWLRGQFPGLEESDSYGAALKSVKQTRKEVNDFYGVKGFDNDDFLGDLSAALSGARLPVPKYQDEYMGVIQNESCRPIKNLFPVFVAKSKSFKSAEFFHMKRNGREKKEGWQIRKMYTEMKKKGKTRKAAVFEFCSCSGLCLEAEYCRAWTSDQTKDKPRLYLANCQRPHRCATSDKFISAGIESVCDRYCDLCACEEPEVLHETTALNVLNITHMYAHNEEDGEDEIETQPINKISLDKPSATAERKMPAEAKKQPVEIIKKEVKVPPTTTRLPLLRQFDDASSDRFGGGWDTAKEAEYEAEHNRQAKVILSTVNVDMLEQIKRRSNDQILFSTEKTNRKLIGYHRSIVSMIEKKLSKIQTEKLKTVVSDVMTSAYFNDVHPMVVPTLGSTTPSAPPLDASATLNALNPFADMTPLPQPVVGTPVGNQLRGDKKIEAPWSLASSDDQDEPFDFGDGWGDDQEPDADGRSFSSLAGDPIRPDEEEALHDNLESDDDSDVEEIVFNPIPKEGEALLKSVETIEEEFILEEHIAVASHENLSWCATLNTSILKIPGSIVNLYQYDKETKKVRAFLPGENDEYATGDLMDYKTIIDGTKGLCKSKTHCGLYVIDYKKTQGGCLANALIRYVKMIVEADDIKWFNCIRTANQRIDQFFTKNAGKRIGFLRAKKTLVMPVFIPFVTLLCSKNSPLLCTTLTTQNILCELRRFVALAHGYMPMDITVGTFLYIIKKNYEMSLNSHAVTNSLMEITEINVGHRATYLDRRLWQVKTQKRENQLAPGQFFTPYYDVTILDGVAMYKLNSDESYFLDSFGRIKSEFHHLTLDSVRFDLVKKKGHVISYDPLRSQIIFNTLNSPVINRVPRFTCSYNFLTFGNQADAQNHLEPTVQSAAMLRLLQPRSNEVELFEAQRKTAIDIIYTMAKIMGEGVSTFDSETCDSIWEQFAEYANHNEQNLHQYNDTPHGSIAVLRDTFNKEAYESSWIFAATWKEIPAGIIANAIINLCQRKSEAMTVVENLLNILEADREKATEDAIRYVGGPKMRARLEMFEKLKRQPLVLQSIEKMALAQIKPFEFQKIKNKDSEQYLQYARIVANLTEIFYFYQNPAAHRIHKKTLSNIYVFNLGSDETPTIKVTILDYDSKQQLEEVFVFEQNDPDLSRFTPFVAASPLSGGTSQYYGVYYSFIMKLHEDQLATHRNCRTPQWIITYSDDSITYKAGKVNESDITKNDLSHTIYSFCVCFASNNRRLAKQLLTSYEVASWPIKVQAIEQRKDYVILLARHLAFLYSGEMLTTGTNNKQDMICLILTIQGGSSSDYGFEMTESVMDAHKASFLSHVFTKLEYPMSASAINQEYRLECLRTGKTVSSLEQYPLELEEIYVAFKLPATILRKFGRRDVAYTRNQTPEEEIYKDILGAVSHSSALYLKALRIGYVTNVLVNAKVRGKNATSRRFFISKEVVFYSQARVAWAVTKPSLTNEDFAILRAHMGDGDELNDILATYLDFCDSLVSKIRPSGFINHKMVDIFNKKRYDMKQSCWSDDTQFSDAAVVDPNLDLAACSQ